MELTLLKIVSHLSDAGWKITVIHFKAKKTPSLYKFLTSPGYDRSQLRHDELDQANKTGSNYFDGNLSSLVQHVYCLPEREAHWIAELQKAQKEQMIRISHAVDKAFKHSVAGARVVQEDKTVPPPTTKLDIRL